MTKASDNEKFFIRSKLAQERKLDKIEKEKNLKKKFVKNLLLRVLSKPTKTNPQVIEFAKKIIQLILLVYRTQPTNSTLKSFLGTCFKKRQTLVDVIIILRKLEISQEKFILFCFWYINKYPMKIWQVLSWIINKAIFDLRKYETAEREFWDDIYNFTCSIKRGKKLMRLIKDKPKVKKDNAALEKLKKI